MKATFTTVFILVASYCLVQDISAETFRIIGLVDQYSPRHEQSFLNGIDYLKHTYNTEEHLLNGDTIEYDVITTMDNDSYGAMVEVCERLQDGVSVLVDMTSRYVTLTMRSLANALGITHVASVDPSFYERDTREYNTSVNIKPPENIMLQSIRAIVSGENLTNVGIIYDQTFNFDDKPKRLLRNIPAQHMYLRMATTENDITAQLDRIKTAELTHLFLACNASNADTYLSAAYGKSMMSFKFKWYVLTKDSRVVCTECQGGTNKVHIVVITPNALHDPRDRFLEYMRLRPENHGREFNFEDIENGEAFIFDMMRLIGLKLEQIRSNWFQIDYADCETFNETDPEALNQAVVLKELIANTSEDFVAGAMHWMDEEASIDIHLSINRVGFIGETRSDNPIGNWSLSGGLHGTIAESDVKQSYRIVTVHDPPFVYRTRNLPEKEGVSFKYYKDESDGGWYYYGYCVDLIFHINETMKFDLTIQESRDGAYGTLQENGSWTGMVNDLIQDEADIIVAPFSVMAERENVIDFTVPYYDLVGITILMKKPPFGYSVFKFMSVLEEAVWGCVLSAFIIVSILLAVFDRYSPYSYQNNKSSWDGQGEEPRVFTLKEGLWFCMTSLTPQGGGEAPRALSGRLLAATWWVFGFIMIATYTANLAAFLTVSRLEQPIESLDDLAKQFKTKYAPQASTSTETYFQRMADIEAKFYTIWKDMSLNDSLDEMERAKLAVWDYPVSDKFTNMWASMASSGFPKTFEEAKKRVKNPGDDEEFAFIGDATQNKHATLTDCELWEVGEEFSRKPYALAVQEGSPLKNELSSRILQLLNQRVLEDLKTKWWEFDRKECPKIEDESDGISIYNIGGVFLVIFIGIGLGLMTLAFEYYWYKWRPAAKNKNTQNGAIPGSEVTNGNATIMANGTNGMDNMAYETRN